MKNRYETIKEVQATIAGNSLTVPKGIELVHVPNCGDASGYAVKEPELLGACKHDSKYYFAYVPASSVFEAKHIKGPVKTKSDDWKETSNQWRITIAGQSFEYWTGSGIKESPTYDDVMNSLLSDSTALEQDFDEWASEYGYDTDSRKAYATWEACCDNARKLIKTGINLQAEKERLQDY